MLKLHSVVSKKIELPNAQILLIESLVGQEAILNIIRLNLYF